MNSYFKNGARLLLLVCFVLPMSSCHDRVDYVVTGFDNDWFSAILSVLGLLWPVIVLLYRKIVLKTNEFKLSLYITEVVLSVYTGFVLLGFHFMATAMVGLIVGYVGLSLYILGLAIELGLHLKQKKYDITTL